MPGDLILCCVEKFESTDIYTGPVDDNIDWSFTPTDAIPALSMIPDSNDIMFDSEATDLVNRNSDSIYDVELMPVSYTHLTLPTIYSV